MRKPRISWRAVGLLFLAAPLTAYSCDAGIENNCTVGADLTWQADGMSFGRIEPRQCPYVVLAPGGLVPLKEIVIAPDYYLDQGLQVAGSVVNALGDDVSAGVAGSFYVPQYDGTAFATVSGAFAGATTDPVHDSAWGASQTPNTQIAWAWAILTGSVDNSSYTKLVGRPSGVLATQAGSWYAEVPLDTVSYLYQWRVNGVPISGATNRTFATTLANGDATISAIVTRSDYTADTITKSIAVHVGAWIDGPTSITSTGTYTWTAVPSGSSSGGYTYQWAYKDYGSSSWISLGTGQSASRGLSTSSSSFSLRVTVSAPGYTSYTAQTDVDVISSGGGGGCNPFC